MDKLVRLILISLHSFQNKLLLKLNFRIVRLIRKGFKNVLTRKDLWEIDEKEKTGLAVKRIEEIWNQRASRYLPVTFLLFLHLS